MSRAPSAEVMAELENSNWNPTHFSQTDLANYNSAEQKIEQWEEAHTNPRTDTVIGNPMNVAGLTDDEKAAVNKYNSLVSNWNPPSGDPHFTGDSFNSNTDYNGNPATIPPADLPSPINGGDDHTGGISVSTDGLRTFANNLKTLQTNIADAQTDIGNVDVKPGQFGLGAKLEQTVNGTNSDDLSKADGLKGTTYAFLEKANDAFTMLHDQIGTMITNYNSTEQLNAMTSKQLDDALSKAFGDISGFSSSAGA